MPHKYIRNENCADAKLRVFALSCWIHTGFTHTLAQPVDGFKSIRACWNGRTNHLGFEFLIRSESSGEVFVRLEGTVWVTGVRGIKAQRVHNNTIREGPEKAVFAQKQRHHMEKKRRLNRLQSSFLSWILSEINSISDLNPYTVCGYCKWSLGIFGHKHPSFWGDSIRVTKGNTSPM